MSFWQRRLPPLCIPRFTSLNCDKNLLNGGKIPERIELLERY
jgi:hypothetical protein